MDLEGQRRKINRINRKIVDNIEERMEVVEQIGEYKKENDLDIRDEEREKAVREKFRTLFEDRDLPSERAGELADYLIDLAVQEQEEQREN